MSGTNAVVGVLASFALSSIAALGSSLGNTGHGRNVGRPLSTPAATRLVRKPRPRKEKAADSQAADGASGVSNSAIALSSYEEEQEEEEFELAGSTETCQPQEGTQQEGTQRVAPKAEQDSTAGPCLKPVRPAVATDSIRAQHRALPCAATSPEVDGKLAAFQTVESLEGQAMSFQEARDEPDGPITPPESLVSLLGADSSTCGMIPELPGPSSLDAQCVDDALSQTRTGHHAHAPAGPDESAAEHDTSGVRVEAVATSADAAPAALAGPESSRQCSPSHAQEDSTQSALPLFGDQCQAELQPAVTCSSAEAGQDTAVSHIVPKDAAVMDTLSQPEPSTSQQQEVQEAVPEVAPREASSAHELPQHEDQSSCPHYSQGQREVVCADTSSTTAGVELPQPVAPAGHFAAEALPAAGQLTHAVPEDMPQSACNLSEEITEVQGAATSSSGSSSSAHVRAEQQAVECSASAAATAGHTTATMAGVLVRADMLGCSSADLSSLPAVSTAEFVCSSALQVLSSPFTAAGCIPPPQPPAIAAPAVSSGAAALLSIATASASISITAPVPASTEITTTAAASVGITTSSSTGSITNSVNPCTPRSTARASAHCVKREPPLFERVLEAGGPLEVLASLTGASADSEGLYRQYGDVLGYLVCSGDAADAVMRCWLLEGQELEAAVEEVMHDISALNRYRVHFSAGVLTTTARKLEELPPPAGTLSPGASGMLGSDGNSGVTTYGCNDFAWAQNVWSFFSA